MPILMILFLFFFLALIFGAHYFFYASAIKFLAIDSACVKKTLLSLCFLLPIAFISSLIMTRFFENFFVKKFYLLISLWHGVLVNLLIACLLAWMFYYIGVKTGLNCNTKIIFLSLLSLVLLISIYGVWNAQHPRLKNITVSIKNLPAEWQGKTIIHLSDIHLGAVNGISFMEKIIEQANSLSPEIILITGDYFDGSYSCLDSLAEPLKKLISKQGIFFVNGNHETYIGRAQTAALLDGTGITHLKNDIVDISGIKIIGADYPGDLKSQNISPLLSIIDPDEPIIFLFHEPRYIEEAKKYGVDLQLAGHTHVGQQWPFNIITRLIYGKYHRGLTTEGDYNIYTSVGVGTWGPPMRLGNTPEIVAITLQKAD